MLEPPATSPAPTTAPAAVAVAESGTSPAPAPIAAEAVASTDLPPAPRLLERLAWYAGAMLLAGVLVTVGMQLWNRDLHAPFYYDLDALLYLPLTRTIVEQGFWNFSHNDRMGAPGVHELYDFPIIDYLHFACLWLIGRVFTDVLVVYNAYSLLTYPLTVLTTMWVLRWMKLSLPIAALGGLLYAFLPYHQERYHYHYFLAAYWWVPVSLVPAIALCHGDFPFFRRDANGNFAPLEIDWPKVRVTASGLFRFSGAAWKTLLAWAWSGTVFVLKNLFTRRALAPIVIGVVTASAGAYYAFFACATYAFAGVYAWVVFRTWRGAMSAALVIAPVIVVGIAYHLPTVVYHLKYGRSSITERQPHEAESYGLKVAHLLLPTNDHNFTPLANLRLKYASPHRPADTEKAGSLGLIGGIGFVALVAMVLLPVRRRWPVGVVAPIAVFLVLLASVGAFGSLFNLLVTAQIRAYNRVSVFIAFLSFIPVLWWLDRFLLTRTRRTMQRLRYPILAGVFILGYFDQTPWGWNPLNPNGMTAIDSFAQRFQVDKQFFKQIETSMPPGAKIFCLPHSGFPESPPVHKMAAYEHARGYVMTDTLKWSYGAIKGREADVWQKDVSYMMPKSPEQMLKRIVARGFDGVLIDGRGFRPARDVDRAAALIERFNGAYRALAWPQGGELPRIVHEDGRQFFLDLQPYREVWRAKMPEEYAAMETREREWVAPLWLAGFLVTVPNDDGEWYVWGTPNATLWIVNPTDRTRNFTMSFTIGVDSAGTFGMNFSGLINDSYSLEKTDDARGVAKVYEFQLPPGRSAIRIRCETPEYFITDTRDLCYFIKDFKLTEK